MNRIPPNDFPLPDPESSELDEANKEVMKACQDKLADTLSMAIKGFCEQIEGRPLEHSEILALNQGRFLRLETHSQQEPEEWENFYIWRRQVLAYCFVQSSILNQGTGIADFEATLRTLWIPESEWPEEVKNFMEGIK